MFMNTGNLKIILIALVLITSVMLFETVKFKVDKDAKRLYSQGMEFYKVENYSDAYYNFKQISRMAQIYQLSLLKQFQCANYLSDKKTAHSKIKELAKLTKDEAIRPYVLYNEAKLALELKTTSNNQSIRKFNYIQKHYPNSDFAIASAYKLAKIENNKKVSKDNYINYLTYAPNGKFSLGAMDELENGGFNLTSSDKEVLADAYLANNNYSKALDLYKETSFNSNWYKISKCYKGLKNLEEEKSTLIKGLELNKSDIEEKDISSALDRLITLTNADKIQTLQTLYSKHPNSYILPTVAYKLAQNSASIRSIKLYEYIVEKYPDSYWASNSLWEVFWYNYKLSRYKICENLAKNHAKAYFNTPDAPRVAYWHGKILLNEKRNLEARDTFYKVIKQYPLSYYSFLSNKALKSSKAHKMALKKPIEGYNINSINKHLFKDKTLLYLADYNDFQTIDELKINDEFIDSWVLNKKENYPMSIKVARDKLSEEEEQIRSSDNKELKIQSYKLKLSYPIKYEKEINKYAAQYKINPYLFLSLVREESHFDSNAKSSAGALGLAQIMPDTANFIEKTVVSKETLSNKEENIRIGIKYFSYLVNYFNGDEYLAILAYNAGPGNINKWRENEFIKSSDIDVFVENIPYIETKNYIKKILSSYWAYLNVYSPKNKEI